MREGRLGSVHSWELVTAVDGPGTRLTTFLSGCPLQCLYCHNPDTLAMKDGQPVTSDELLTRIARYTAVFQATGGGITLSGGEVLMQPAFAARILRGAKDSASTPPSTRPATSAPRHPTPCWTTSTSSFWTSRAVTPRPTAR
jgi:pyruvate formate lyase activating enzyme